MIRQGYVALPNKVVSCLPAMKGSDYKVLSAVWSYLPRAFPSVATLARKTGLCINTVRAALKRLYELRLLKKHIRFGSSNFYQINPELLTQKMQDKVVRAVKECVEVFNTKILGRIRQKVVAPPLPKIGTLTNKAYAYLNQSSDIPSVSFGTGGTYSMKSVMASLGMA